MSTLAAAIEWAGHGIPVVCCAGKNPGRLLGEGWQHQATTDPQTIKAWWVKWPNANVGIVPGRRLLPIDVDQPDEFKRFEAEHGPAPPTPRYLTNGEPGVPRERLLLRHPWCDLKDKLAPGVQLRDDNLMSVVPPSLNPDSGEHYEWLTSPDEVPFAAMSTAWLKRAAVPENRFAKYTNGGPAPPIGDRIPKGVQHDTLVSFAGTMRRRGATADEIFAALMVRNQRCERPGPETNIRRIAESVAKYPPAAAAATPDVPAAGGHGRLVYGHEVSSSNRNGWSPANPEGRHHARQRRPRTGQKLLHVPDRGRRQPRRLGDPPAGVVFASAEDSFAGRIVQRAVAAGAERRLVAAFDIHDEHSGRNMELPEGVTELAEMVAEMGAAMVVVDPLNAHLSTALDSFKDHGIRKALAPLARMADKLEVACVVVCHLNKDRGGAPLYRTSGSIGYVGAARSVLGFGPDPEDEDDGPLRLLEHVKSNWSELAPTEQYRMETATVVIDDDIHATNRLVYVGEVDRDTGAVFGKRAPEDRGADAEEAIAEALAGGAKPSRQVKTAVMDELSCSERTVIRAAKRMEDAGELAVEAAGRSTNWRLLTRDTVGLSRVSSQQSEDETPVLEPKPGDGIGDTPIGDTGRVTNRDELRRRFTEGWGQ